jgi:hypothetical protein
MCPGGDCGRRLMARQSTVRSGEAERADMTEAFRPRPPGQKKAQRARLRPPSLPFGVSMNRLIKFVVVAIAAYPTATLATLPLLSAGGRTQHPSATLMTTLA